MRRRLRTLDALLAYLLSGAPPDTSTADPGTGARPDVPPTVLIAILTGMVAGAWVARRPRRQIPRRQG